MTLICSSSLRKVLSIVIMLVFRDFSSYVSVLVPVDPLRFASADHSSGVAQYSREYQQTSSLQSLSVSPATDQLWGSVLLQRLPKYPNFALYDCINNRLLQTNVMYCRFSYSLSLGEIISFGTYEHEEVK